MWCCNCPFHSFTDFCGCGGQTRRDSFYTLLPFQSLAFCTNFGWRPAKYLDKKRSRLDLLSAVLSLPQPKSLHEPGQFFRLTIFRASLLSIFCNRILGQIILALLFVRTSWMVPSPVMCKLFCHHDLDALSYSRRRERRDGRDYSSADEVGKGEELAQELRRQQVNSIKAWNHLIWSST